MTSPAIAARSRAELLEDLDWLLGTDHPENIAARLGTNCAALERRLRNMGRPDLARQFAPAAMARP